MNIAFDATAILGPFSKNRGIGNYALSQFKTMINLDQNNKYFMFNVFEDFDIKKYVINKDNVKVEYFYSGRERFLASQKEYSEVYGSLVKAFIQKNEIDVFYITSPFDGHCTRYEKAWFGDTKVVATVYDIIPYIFKESYLSNKETNDWYMRCIDMLHFADMYLVISQSVKDDMVKYLHFPPDKIRVIWGAVDDRFKQIEVSAFDKNTLFEKYNIVGKFIMCTGGDDERKNLAGLIEAYSNLEKDLINNYQLVIVCKLSAFADKMYKNIIKELRVEGRVILTNFVSDNELLLLYNLASLMAFPSKYEGFGLPVVEAFACGVPVVTSNNSSLVEIAGDAAILVNPFSVADITRGLEEALHKKDTKEMCEKGVRRLEHFQWPEVAKSAISAINSLKSERNETDSVRNKIAIFTPLPPIQSGISDYSVDIISSLSLYFDIDVFIDDSYDVIAAFPLNVHILNHTKFDSRVIYIEIIYQMGNSHYHTYMYPYIKEHRGLVVLHDYNMHGIAQSKALYSENSDYELYRSYLYEDFNTDLVDEYIDKLRRGVCKPRINEMELNGFITNYANKIIVHSDEAKEKLLRKNISKCVRTIHSYANIEPIKGKNYYRREFGFEDTDVICASFGHVHETKRSMPILKAFVELSCKYDDLKYIFVGKLDAALENEFGQFVQENHLEEKVIVTGYIDLEEFIRYIEMADICVNLRYPYNGETSGTLMRILAKGKCALVNDIGSFGELPDEICVKLPNAATRTEEQEIADISSSLEYLIKNEDYRAKIGKNARRYAEKELDLKVIAKQYKEFICFKDVSSINEKSLKDIAKNELQVKGYTESECHYLAHTLAYCKN